MLNKRLLGVLRQYGISTTWVVGETVLNAMNENGLTNFETSFPSPFSDPEARQVLEGSGNGRAGISDIGYPPEDVLEELLTLGRWVSPATTGRNTKYDRLLPWLANRIHRRIWKELHTAREEYIFLGRLALLLSEIADWVHAERVDLLGGRYSVDDAIEAVEEWQDTMAEAADQTEPPEQGPVIFVWDDGWTIQDLNTRSLLQSEGSFMGTCVGQPRYWDAVRTGASFIYSLRDPRGRSKATVEAGSIVELEPTVKTVIEQYLVDEVPWSSPWNTGVLYSFVKAHLAGHAPGPRAPEVSLLDIAGTILDTHAVRLEDIVVDPYMMDEDDGRVLLHGDYGGSSTWYDDDDEDELPVEVTEDGLFLLAYEQRYRKLLEEYGPEGDVNVVVSVEPKYGETLSKHILDLAVASGGSRKTFQIRQVYGKGNNEIARWSLCERLIEFFEDFLDVLSYQWGNTFHRCRTKQLKRAQRNPPHSWYYR